MAKWDVLIRFTGLVNMQIEADSEAEARDIAYEVDTYDVDEWCVDIDECERIDD